MSAANESDVELHARREISYLQATMYYFVDHINTITALSWQEKLSLLMNENKRIANPWIKIVKSIGRWKMRWNNTKPHNGRNFQYTKFSVSELVLTGRRNLSGTRPKLACGKSSNCRFSSLGARNAITKATEYIIFGFSFHILVFSPFNKVWTLLSVSDTDFLVF